MAPCSATACVSTSVALQACTGLHIAYCNMIQHSEATTKARELIKSTSYGCFVPQFQPPKARLLMQYWYFASLVAFANFALNMRFFISRKHGASCLNIWRISYYDWLKDVWLLKDCSGLVLECVLFPASHALMWKPDVVCLWSDPGILRIR